MMEGRRVILKDGTRFENGEAGYASGFLWLYLRGCSMASAASTFMNPLKTDLIVFQYGDMEDRYEGFTKCTDLMDDRNGTISVCMVKP